MICDLICSLMVSPDPKGSALFQSGRAFHCAGHCCSTRVRWRIVGRNAIWEGDFDLFNDGALKLVKTPGHSPGHQVLIVDLVDQI
jgi:glyoxylase-like metal-dependent hydrolase (beta-lactamase superfamily II)